MFQCAIGKATTLVPERHPKVIRALKRDEVRFLHILRLPSSLGTLREGGDLVGSLGFISGGDPQRRRSGLQSGHCDDQRQVPSGTSALLREAEEPT